MFSGPCKSLLLFNAFVVYQFLVDVTSYSECHLQFFFIVIFLLGRDKGRKKGVCMSCWGNSAAKTL